MVVRAKPDVKLENAGTSFLDLIHNILLITTLSILQVAPFQISCKRKTQDVSGEMMWILKVYVIQIIVSMNMIYSTCNLP